MADIAQLGFSADTSELVKAKTALDALVPSAGKVDAVVGKVGVTFAETGGVVGKASQGIVNSNVSMKAAASGAAVLNNAVNDVFRTITPFSAALGKTNAQLAVLKVAYANGALGADEFAGAQAILGQRISLLQAKQAVFTEKVALGTSAYKNSTRGLTSLTTGLFALSNGLSAGNIEFLALFEVIERFNQVTERAALQGISAGQAFKRFASEMLISLGPLLPVLIPIGIAIGVIASAFGLAERSIVQSTGNIAAGMHLSAEQMDRLKEKGTSVTVTLGDTFKAFFVTLGQEFSEGFAGPLASLSNGWKSTLDFITLFGIQSTKIIIGSFVGAYAYIVASWKNLPAVFGDLFYSAANAAIKGVNWLTSKVIEGVNALGGHLKGARLDEVANPFKGASGKGLAAYKQGFEAAGAAVDRFGVRWTANAKKIRQGVILDDAGKPNKGRTNKSDPWGDLVEGAQNDIATQKARTDAVNMSAEAAATLEQRTKLLNDANSKGIKLDAAKRATIDALAAAYGKAKAAADNAKSAFDITSGAQKDIDTLKNQGNAIGLVGRQLAYQTEMTKLLADAEAKKLPVDDALRAQFEGLANKYADASAANDNVKYYTDATAAANENIDMLRSELAQIGMNNVAVAAAAERQKLLNDEKYRGIVQSPAEQQNLIATAEAQARLNDQISQTKDAFDFVRSSASGFISTLRSDLAQGEGLFKSFTDTVLNLLNKVIDKLLEVSLNSAMGGGGGGIGGFLGGIAKAIGFGNTGAASGTVPASYGPVTFAAKGDAFGSQGIVSNPTLFAFAKGGALGVMGESGPEAVMPLQRGADGSLGVQAHGNGGGSRYVNAPVQVDNHYTIAGAVSSEEITARIRQTAEITKNDVKKSLNSWLYQSQRDGAIS